MIFFSTAEPSGDLQAAALAAELQKLHPGLEMLGVGGHKLAQAGVKLIADSSTWGSIGPSEAVAKIPRIYLAYRKMRQVLLEKRPDLTIMVDCPAVHYRLAGFAKRHGLKTLWYVPPSQWARNPKRFRALHERVTSIITPFKYNADNYARLGLEVGYYGHPLIDVIGEPPSREEAQKALGVPAGRYVTLLPGSRTQEIRYITPLLLQVAAGLKTENGDLQFLLPIASPALEKQLRARIPRPPAWLHLFQGRAREAMAASVLGVMASGSASLEAALLGLPHVVVYKGSNLDWLIYMMLYRLGLLRVERFALANLVLQEDVMPEFLQEYATPEAVTREALSILQDGPKRQKLIRDLERVKRAVGEPGVVQRVARHVERLLVDTAVQPRVN